MWRLHWPQVNPEPQMIPFVKLTARSSNRKTGPIATTISSSDTCPTTCPFNKGGGCYAAGGPTAIHWRKLDRRETGTPILDFGHQLAAAKLKPGSLLRWNVAGDLPHYQGEINLPVLQQLVGLWCGAPNCGRLRTRTTCKRSTILMPLTGATGLGLRST